jgi:hypothetical protein
MPSAADLKNFHRLQGADTPQPMMPKFPELPAEVVARFPTLKDWHKQVIDWTVKMGITVRPNGPV